MAVLATMRLGPKLVKITVLTNFTIPTEMTNF